jgi:hypothetical protein
MLSCSGMRTLARSTDLEGLLVRLGTVSARDAALWGRMSAQQMLCHLSDSALIPLGEMRVSDVSSFTRRTIMKWGALYAPAPWPKSAPTPPEVDQCLKSRPPGDFEADRSRLLQLTLRLRDADLNGRSHPFFGLLRQEEWMRWAWLHADHHLRQFGH